MSNNNGFTLVELIILVALLGIIMAIAVPKYTNARDKVKEDADYVTAAMIAKAAELYAATEGESGNIALEKIKPYLNNDVKFQNFKDISGLTITVTDTITTVKVGDVQLYPKPESDT